MLIIALRVGQWLLWGISVALVLVGVFGGTQALASLVFIPMFLGLAAGTGALIKRLKAAEGRPAAGIPARAALPVGDFQPVTAPSRTAIRWFWGIGGTAVILPLCFLPYLKGLAWVLTGSFGLVMAVMLPFFYADARLEEQAIARLAAGERWVAWQYSPAEWQAFAQSLVRRYRRALLWPGSLLMGPLLFLGIVGAAAPGSPFPALVALGIPVLFCGCLIGGVFLHTEAILRCFRREQPAVIIGPNGFIMSGRYYNIRSAFARLDRVTLLTGDLPQLHFSSSGGGFASSDLYLPVPAGREGEARALVNRLHAAQHKAM